MCKNLYVVFFFCIIGCQSSEEYFRIKVTKNQVPILKDKLSCDQFHFDSLKKNKPVSIDNTSSKCFFSATTSDPDRPSALVEGELDKSHPNITR